MNIISTKKLTRIYNSGETGVVAVNNVELDIRKGETTAIVGQSGSGKSSLLHLLGGVDIPTEGTVLIDGEDMYALDDEKRTILRRRKIGFVFQAFNLIPVLTVEENIAMPLLLDGNRVDKEEIEEVMDKLGIIDRRKHLPNQLSGGQQQRVAVARAVIHRPPIILADEPTGNLDSRNSMEVMDLFLRAVREREQTLVLITHENDIAAMADRVLHIEDGRIVSDTSRSKKTYLR